MTFTAGVDRPLTMQRLILNSLRVSVIEMNSPNTSTIIDLTTDRATCFAKS